jgi:hypothetical protein
MTGNPPVEGIATAAGFPRTFRPVQPDERATRKTHVPYDRNGRFSRTDSSYERLKMVFQVRFHSPADIALCPDVRFALYGPLFPCAHRRVMHRISPVRQRRMRGPQVPVPRHMMAVMIRLHKHGLPTSKECPFGGRNRRHVSNPPAIAHMA